MTRSPGWPRRYEFHAKARRLALALGDLIALTWLIDGGPLGGATTPRRSIASPAVQEYGRLVKANLVLAWHADNSSNGGSAASSTRASSCTPSAAPSSEAIEGELQRTPDQQT